MKQDHKKEVVIGLCVILALCFLFFGIEYLKGINVFKPSNYYLVSYTNVNGLAISAPVTVNGYKVGLVRNMEYEYDNPGHVLVELSLDKELKIPVNSKAIIKSDVLGTATVALEMSTEKDYHDVGNHLIGETESGMMESVSTNLMPSVEKIFPKVDSLLTSLNKLTGDPALIAAIQRLDAISANLDATMKQLNKSTGALPKVMNNVESTTENLSQLSGALAELSTDLKKLPVDSTFANLHTLSENLAKMSQELNNPNSTLGLMMHDPALYNNLNTTVNNLDSLFIDIKKNPKRYINVKVF